MAETPGSRALSPTPILLAQPKQAPCGLRARHPGLPPGSAPRQPRRSLPALPRRALTSVPPRRPPAVPARPRPRRTQAAAPWLAGAAGTERREARGTALPPCPCHPPPLSRQRGRDVKPPPGAGGGVARGRRSVPPAAKRPRGRGHRPRRSARAPPLLPHQVSPLRRAVLSSAATSVRWVSRSAAPPSAIFSARQRQRRQEQERAALHAGSDACGGGRGPALPRGRGAEPGAGAVAAAPPGGREVFRGGTGGRHFPPRLGGSACVIGSLVPRRPMSALGRSNSCVVQVLWGLRYSE